MRRKQKSGSNVVLISVIATIVVAAGATAFVLIHPGGRRAFKSFLMGASGETPDESDGAADAGTDEPAGDAGDAGDAGQAQPHVADPEALAKIELARKALELLDPDGAESFARQAKRIDPECVEAQEILERIPEIRARVEKMEKQAAHDAAVKAGDEFLKEGDLERAGTRADEALGLFPDSTAALALKSRIAAERSRLEDDKRDARARADDVAHEGSQALAAGDHDRALELAADADTLDPGNRAAGILRTQAEIAKKRAEAEVAAAAARAKAEDAAREATAKAEADAAEAKRTEAQKHFEVAELCFRAEDMDGAESFAKKALTADPSHEGARALLAKIPDERKRLAWAREEEALDKEGPDGTETVADAQEEQPPEAEAKVVEVVEPVAEPEVPPVEPVESVALVEPAGPKVIEHDASAGPAEFVGTSSTGPAEFVGVVSHGDPPPPPVEITLPAGGSGAPGPSSFTATAERSLNSGSSGSPGGPGAAVANPGTGPLALPSGAAVVGVGAPAGAETAIAALYQLDRALQNEDLAALGRLLSERSSGAGITGGRVTRAEELANASEFFELASEIRIERNAPPELVRSDALTAEARSSHRISYRIAGQRVSRAYTTRYELANEAGAWRIARVTTEQERP